MSAEDRDALRRPAPKTRGAPGPGRGYRSGSKPRAAVAVLAAILRATHVPPIESTRDERKRAACAGTRAAEKLTSHLRHSLVSWSRYAKAPLVSRFAHWGTSPDGLSGRLARLLCVISSYAG